MLSLTEGIGKSFFRFETSVFSQIQPLKSLC